MQARELFRKPTEYHLFLEGIKPAIIMSYPNLAKFKEEMRKRDIEDKAYIYTDGIRKGKMPLVSWNEIDIKKVEQSELGVILGYYPGSCKKFEEFMDEVKEGTADRTRMEYINFNGIRFNTEGLFDEAFDWCMKTYGEKMLKIYGKIVVEKKIVDTTEDNQRVTSRIERVFFEAVSSFDEWKEVLSIESTI